MCTFNLIDIAQLPFQKGYISIYAHTWFQSENSLQSLEEM